MGQTGGWSIVPCISFTCLPSLRICLERQVKEAEDEGRPCFENERSSGNERRGGAVVGLPRLPVCWCMSLQR